MAELNKEPNNIPELPELPLIQKVALEGEISHQYLMAYSEENAMVRTYIMLKCSSKESFPYYHAECCKHLGKENIDKCMVYINAGIFPVEFFVNNFIEDLLICFDKINGFERKCGNIPPMTLETLKSRFVCFITEFSLVSPKLTREFLNKVIESEDEEIMQLKELAFSVRATVPVFEEEDLNDINFISLIKLLQDSMISCDLMSFERERKAFKEQEGSKENVIEEDENKVYIVNKIDKSSGKVIFPKEFKTHSEASNFIIGIKNDYPELFNRYEFVIKVKDKGSN